MLGKIDYGVMSITPSLGGSTLQLSSGITQGARHAHRPPILGAVLAHKHKRR
jgi:hypothetical protein